MAPIRKNYSNTTTLMMKSSSLQQWFVLSLIVLIVTTEFGLADCRALPSKTTNNAGNAGCEQVDSVGGQEVGMASFSVSSNNSSSRPLARSLAFRLASGPSKKGPGH